MEALFILLTVSLLLGLLFLGAFLWATHRGQFDDVQTPAWRILNEDESLPARISAVPDSIPLPTKSPRPRRNPTHEH